MKYTGPVYEPVVNKHQAGCVYGAQLLVLAVCEGMGGGAGRCGRVVCAPEGTSKIWQSRGRNFKRVLIKGREAVRGRT